MIRNFRPVRIAFACIAAAAVLALPSSASAGNLLVTGHDTDVHCGSFGLDTGPHCHLIHTITQWVRAGAPDATKPLLLVSCTSNLAASVSSAYNGMPPVSDTICPTNSAFPTWPIDTGHYSAMIVSSGFSGMSPTASTALNARKSDVEDFFNHGGGVFANTGLTVPTYYGFLPLTVGAGSNTPPYALTADGLTFGMQDSQHGAGIFDDINCCATHNSFSEPAAGGPITVAERDAHGQAITMFAQGQINGGAIVAPTAPETSIDATPDAHSPSSAATFAFSSTPAGATFECQVDGGAWTACVSPLVLTGLGDGDHTLSVRAASAGLTDASPSTFAWNVRVPAAVTPAVDPPATPAPAPAKPVAPRISANLPGDAAKSAVARTEVVVRSGDAFGVGCRMQGGSVRTCTVTAVAGTGRAARVVGRGTVTVDASGHTRVTVPLALTRAGRAALRGADHGLSVRLQLKAVAVGGSSLVTSSRKVLLRPSRQRIVRGMGEFSPNSAALRADTRHYLQSLRNVVATARSVTCTGHTASQSGHAGAEVNRALGLRRARAVCAELVRNGFRGRTSVRTRAGTSPRATNHTPSGRGLNRRVELLVVR